jgi:hypothetical protein
LLQIAVGRNCSALVIAVFAVECEYPVEEFSFMPAAQATIVAPKRKTIPGRQLLIHGRWREPADGASMPTFDPTTEEKITDVAKASPADADEAVRSASKAFEEGPWSRLHH